MLACLHCISIFLFQALNNVDIPENGFDRTTWKLSPAGWGATIRGMIVGLGGRMSKGGDDVSFLREL